MFSEKAVILIKKASLEFDKIANPILQEHNLTGAQYKIVKYLLMHKDENVRQIDIEKYYSLTHPTAIGLLDKLEEKGFVKREVNPNDGRSRIITLTDMAISKQAELIEVGDLLESELTCGLSKTERNQLIGLLDKLLAGIEDKSGGKKK